MKYRVKARHLAVLVATFVLAGASHSVLAASGDFDYSTQDNWKPAAGEMQSPVAIDSASAVNGRTSGEDARLVLHHRPGAAAKVVDTGHALQVDFAPGNWAMLRGRRVELLQMHFHAPGEHVIDGKTYPVEGHFVYRGANGRLSVIGVNFRQGAANAGAAKLLDAFARGGSGASIKLNTSSLIAPLNDYYHYIGSLTAPPLSQNVEWYVLARPMSLSAGQIAAIKRVHDGNARKPQALNGRPMLHVTGK